MRRYIIGRGWGPHPAAAESPKEKERKKGKPKNQKFEALYNREGLGPPPGSSGKESPKIRNLRRYIKGRGWGPHPTAAESPKEKENEKGKPKNQKFEALYNRMGLGPPPSSEKERKKGKPKNQKFEALYNREGLGPPPGSRAPKREGKRERKAQKSKI